MDWMQSLGLFGGLGQAGQGLFGLFGGNKNNPANAANKYLNQIPGAVEPYYSPFINAGKGAMGDLQNQYKDLISGNVQNQLGQNYKESPGYQFKLKQALQAGSNAAAAGGMLGTPMNQQNQMQTANDLAAQDYNDYIKNQMGLYGLGTGIGSDIFGKGYDASTGYGNLLGSTLGTQAQYGYAGQAGQNQGNANAWNNIFQGLGLAGLSGGGQYPSWLFGGSKGA